MTIELLHLTKDTVLANLGEFWIVLGICLLAYFTVVNMILQDPAAAFIITVIPFSLVIVAGFLTADIAAYMLIGLAIIVALSMSRLFIK